MKRTVLCALVCAAMAGGLFTGCAKKEAAGGAEAKSGTVNLTFMGWEASPLETEAVKNGIAAFEKANPGITVTYTPISQTGYTAKMMSLMSSNAAPDVFFTQSGDYRAFAKRGMLLELTERFNAGFPLSDFIESSRTIMTIDGKVYGISSCNVSPIIYYNRAIFDKYNEPYPSADPAKAWTIDEFRAVAKRLTRDGIYGCYGLETQGLMINAQILSAGGAIFSSDYNKCAINSPQAKKTLATIKSIRVDDKSMPSSSTLENIGMNAVQMLQTGKIAMLMDGSWSLQQLSTLGFPVGIAPLPSYGKVVTTGQAHLHAIFKNTKHPEEAWKFLQFLSGMDYQGQLSKEGLWLPNRLSLWADGPSGIDGWYDEARLGPYYREMKNYLIDVLVEPSAMQKTTIVYDIQSEELEKYFKDDADLDATLAGIERRVNKELADL